MISNRRGAIAVAVIIVLLIVNLVVMGLVLSGSRDHDLTVKRVGNIRAFYAAESGVNMAIREIPVGADEDGVAACVTRGDQGCTGATYDDQAMIETLNERTSTSSGNEWLQIYYLTNPPTGTSTVSVTFGI